MDEEFAEFQFIYRDLNGSEGHCVVLRVIDDNCNSDYCFEVHETNHTNDSSFVQIDFKKLEGNVLQLIMINATSADWAKHTGLPSRSLVEISMHYNVEIVSSSNQGAIENLVLTQSGKFKVGQNTSGDWRGPLATTMWRGLEGKSLALYDDTNDRFKLESPSTLRSLVEPVHIVIPHDQI